MTHMIDCALWFFAGLALRDAFARAAARAAELENLRLTMAVASEEEERSKLSSEVFRLKRKVTELRDALSAEQDNFEARVSDEAHDYLEYRREEEEQMRQDGWLPCASCRCWRDHTQGPVCMTCQEQYVDQRNETAALGHDGRVYH